MEISCCSSPWTCRFVWICVFPCNVKQTALSPNCSVTTVVSCTVTRAKTLDMTTASNLLQSKYYRPLFPNVVKEKKTLLWAPHKDLISFLWFVEPFRFLNSRGMQSCSLPFTAVTWPQNHTWPQIITFSQQVKKKKKEVCLSWNRARQSVQPRRTSPPRPPLE